MIFRIILASSIFGLVACGAQTTANSGDRLEQVENDCGVLATEASLNTGKAATQNFCYCMVQLLEEGPDVNVDAVSQTLAVVTEEHKKSGKKYGEIATTLREAAEASNASGRSVSLGIGVDLVEDISKKIKKRSKSGTC